MSKTKLTINENGSVKIEGDFEIVDKKRKRLRIARQNSTINLSMWFV